MVGGARRSRPSWKAFSGQPACAARRPKALLKKRGSLREPLKSSASEDLNFIILLRVFLTSFVMPECPGSLRQSCTAWLQLAAVLDLLLKVNDGTVTARTLQDNIKRHLDLMLRLYGPDDCWIPNPSGLARGTTP